jgi:hypothetical protein
MKEDAVRRGDNQKRRHDPAVMKLTRCATGHPSFVMSCSFSNQAESYPY